MEAKVPLRFIVLVLISGLVCGTGHQGKRTLNTLDLAADKQVTVCSKRKSPLTCESPGSAIAITGVFWGRQSQDVCPSEDGDRVTDCPTAPETEHIVKEMCEGMGSCILEGKAGNYKMETLLRRAEISSCELYMCATEKGSCFVRHGEIDNLLSV
ncbi:hypothetical protein OS493_036744 [Desmophyllum pertusum]|uniref:SUEL-type lectin domain-containing protein n=1 Tax=Desmophyllum pertusum TaxID=174260 RepID=A0A9X0CVT3_9CNID|nr:hypothetical protein OS493_036744 [Desmophyllum pertusum]